MEEKDAIELLGKLENFMTQTSEAIKNLITITHNLKVDVDNLKKDANKNRIIVRN